MIRKAYYLQQKERPQNAEAPRQLHRWKLRNCSNFVLAISIQRCGRQFPPTSYAYLRLYVRSDWIFTHKSGGVRRPLCCHNNHYSLYGFKILLICLSISSNDKVYGNLINWISLSAQYAFLILSCFTRF